MTHAPHGPPKPGGPGALRGCKGFVACRHYLVVALPGGWPLPEGAYESCCPSVDLAGVRLCLAWRRGCPRPGYCDAPVRGGDWRAADSRGYFTAHASSGLHAKALLRGYVALNTGEGVVVAVDEESPYTVEVDVRARPRRTRGPTVTLTLYYTPEPMLPRRGWLY